MKDGLLDTSVLVDLERGEPVGLPDVVFAVSAVSIAELHVGVLLAGDGAVRAARLASTIEVERRFEPLPVDGMVARAFAQLVVGCRERGESPTVMDTLIAATAAVHDLTLFTRDKGFDVFDGVDVRLV